MIQNIKTSVSPTNPSPIGKINFFIDQNSVRNWFCTFKLFVSKCPNYDDSNKSKNNNSNNNFLGFWLNWNLSSSSIIIKDIWFDEAFSSSIVPGWFPVFTTILMLPNSSYTLVKPYQNKWFHSDYFKIWSKPCQNSPNKYQNHQNPFKPYKAVQNSKPY